MPGIDQGRSGRFLLAALALSGLAACMKPPPSVEPTNKLLASENKHLKSRVRGLENTAKALMKEKAEVMRLRNILEREKSFRVTEVEGLKKDLRYFIRKQYQLLDSLAKNPLLTVKAGAELVERQYSDGKDVLILDRANPAGHTGNVLKLSGYFTQPTKFLFYVLRPSVDGKTHRVTFKSKPFTVVREGKIDLPFDTPVPVMTGDLFAYHFPEAVGVYFDEDVGGAKVWVDQSTLRLNQKFDPASGKGPENRAYSLQAQMDLW